jgi:hypothetical protein
MTLPEPGVSSMLREVEVSQGILLVDCDDVQQLDSGQIDILFALKMIPETRGTATHES